MKNIFKFSIIIAIYNVEDYLNETIDSIINQTLNFKKNVQLILVDDGSSDNSLKIALDYNEKYPENILVLSKENGGQASARNLGLKYVKGKYVNFLDSDDYLSKNTLKNVYNFFEKHENEIDIVTIPMQLFERVNGPHRLNYKFKENGILNLDENPNSPLLSASSSFIKYDSIKNYEFDANLVNLEDALIINKILLDKKQYGVINNCSYYYRQRISRNSTVDNITSKKEYFTDRLNNFFLELINYCLSKEGKVPYFIQYLMVYDLQWMLQTPDLDVFDSEYEISEFWNVLNQVLDFISSDVIRDNENLSNNVKGFFLYLKGGKQFVSMDNSGLIWMNIDDYGFDRLDEHRVWLDIIKLKKGILHISGVFLSPFDNENISFRVVKDNNHLNEYSCKYVKYNTSERNNKSFLGKIWVFCYNFDVEIPINPHDECNLKFFVDYDFDGQKCSFELLIGLNYNVNLSKYGAYIFDNSHIILVKFNKLYIKRHSFSSVLRYEYSNLKSMIIDKPDYYKKAIFMRLLYFVVYFFIKNKKIWIFGDRPDFADDNAKHLFKYSITKEDKIKKYFVIDKNSNSFNELKKRYKNVVPFGSLKHKILFLFSEKNISSYVNENFINPFYYENPELYAGLSNSDRLFLQHGVTKDDISKFIKKYNNDLSLIVTVSDLEKTSFLKEGYNFDENVIQVLGFPRYDNLKNNLKKKQILFMPTWRLQFENKDIFSNSNYFKTLNSFLNNELLFELLNKHGYKLVFKPHAELMEFINLLEINEDVYLSLNESYQDLFNNSSVLITDFSSVFFDFAYLKKPVIYYQADEDYHYDEGYFNYETMGFGETIRDELSLIKKISYYLENNCQMEMKYKNNVDKFFKFNDNKNCERVYNWILNH